ncbi:putative RNA recognition motif domain, nucleotide-binding alpha-beta plait domain superfamily [Helianthus annuus]|uniref:Putative RNA-binding (RRM/RBD/RNP motifs) family protein n=1 Tax=Helianthus annuus TaxID=4232 RepID=A0A251VH99_HELAN|nr:29 kDa ribonucleoprotein A, chloroplastic [Helianthus annuus]KAF5819410.1 putative RNA recognition motif domain, nucleotide-binding alpha-beta plait domain superfamily [Helianthus annuus]KAJ0605563.1 putative RNA recognition motif domain, nucleotide-binding alpha-beta plait domain superfamily [Helianthus annuus]KAJ0616399.1 putative RNA recognition motif domain, nucleotide-binding alpha-beta plait domain superfamily [Helianthus annuus]KAJ0619578.1 putative RNA recognition motif domain, nucle
MASSASPLQLHPLSSSKPLSSFTKTPTPNTLHLFPSSLTPFPKLLCSTTLFEPTPSSRITRNVAVSSGFELDEELSDDQQEQSFSPDLKIFVGNMPFSVDSAALAGLFETAGNVEMVEVIYDKVTGRSRGFGFVTMSSVEEVEEAVRKFNGYELDGRALRVNSGPPPPRREDSSFGGPREGGRGGGGRSFDNTNRVYVGNLAWSVDNVALETLFREQGNVVEAKVVYDRESGRSRGFGFVTFSSADEVNSAVDSLDGVDLDGRNIRVSVAEAPQRRQF